MDVHTCGCSHMTDVPHMTVPHPSRPTSGLLRVAVRPGRVQEPRDDGALPQRDRPVHHRHLDPHRVRQHDDAAGHAADQRDTGAGVQPEVWMAPGPGVDRVGLDRGLAHRHRLYGGGQERAGGHVVSGEWLGFDLTVGGMGAKSILHLILWGVL